MAEKMMDKKIRLGISACLLGQQVRFDGGHKHDRFITETLGQYVEFVPVCPEVECGLGIPREAMRLVGEIEQPRLVTIRSRKDYTEQMQTWAQHRVQELAAEDLGGFIFKSDSPSSGMERVRVYDDHGMPVKKGKGLFARIFMEHFPLLPVEDEGRLHDPKLRENFIEAIFAFKRWRDLGAKPSRKGLVDFHTRHKLLLLAHSPEHYRELGRVVAHSHEQPLEVVTARYQQLLLESLRLKTTPKKNANVLIHILGYFKKDLSGDEKQELLDIIDHYRLGNLPLIVPVTLLNHYVRKYEQPYLQEQYYLHPHPLELQLRNHA
jgi:uncharacterized protein YbgA (DUF1722 family)/uncharacterized protein YbbK (DUF523 family)